MAQVKAFSLGGIGAPCCCAHPGCNVTFCAGNRCCIASGVGAGTLIQVYTVGGGTLIVSGTTASNGCVTLDIHTAGTYDVHITFAGSSSVIIQTNQALTCGSTKTYSGLNPGNFFCCNCCIMSNSLGGGGSLLYLTDANGTFNTNYSSSLACFGGTAAANNCTPTGCWTVNYNLSLSNVILVNTSTNACTVVPGTTNICYVIICQSPGGVWSVVVTRYWWVSYCQSGFHTCGPTPPFTLGYCPSAPLVPNPCCISSTGPTDPAGIYLSTATLAVPSGITCNPFTWSSSLTPAGSPPLPDPVGGTVVVQN